MEKSGLGLETLGELCSLWRSGAGAHEYSQEFLADTICTDIERQRRLLEARLDELDEGVKPDAEFFQICGDVQGGVNLLRQDPALGRAALEYAYSKGMFKVVRNFVKRVRSGRYAEEILAEEGMDILFDYDSLNLLLTALSEAQLSFLGKLKLRKEKLWFLLTTKLLHRKFAAFYNAAPMVRGYCINWEVEEKSPLQRIADIVSPLPELVMWERENPPADSIPLSCLRKRVKTRW